MAFVGFETLSNGIPIDALCFARVEALGFDTGRDLETKTSPLIHALNEALVVLIVLHRHHSWDDPFGLLPSVFDDGADVIVDVLRDDFAAIFEENFVPRRQV